MTTHSKAAVVQEPVASKSGKRHASVTVRFNVESDQPFRVEGVPTFESSDTKVLTVEPSADGLTATIRLLTQPKEPNLGKR